ncbi:hypothetical protein PAF17_15815 [Paracoccus sp. Z330]|uniref:Uncharacterized protein n=1 Tax=Paracoccus onchidii TaxID=3017813 RepID=A0ABT4ZIZ0_9RHOB|nr:hypothetical protein [Paracoccus onchidii]MDB6178958.1 hypothetical protein [Paracoccus onchidii]
MTPDRCHWLKDEDGEEILIPMCCGGAVYGSYACTCTVPESRIEAAERGRAEAERQVQRLCEARDRRLDEQKASWNMQRRLRRRIAELETMLAEQSS